MTPPPHYIAVDFRRPPYDGLVTWDDVAAYVRGLGMGGAYLGPNRMGAPTWETIYPTATYWAFVRAFRAAGVEPILMPMIHRDLDHIRDMLAWLRPFAEDGVGVLLDAEEGWVTQHGGRSLRRAVDALVEGLANWSSRLGLTSYTLCPPQVVPLLPDVNFCMPQALSLGNRPEHIYRPGVMQREAVDSWRRRGADELVMQLPTYAQRHPHPWPRGVAALQAAYDAATAEDIQGVSWWSLKHVLGNNAVAAHLRSLR